MARRCRNRSPCWRDLSSPSSVIPAAAAGAHTDVAAWRDAVDQLPPPPLFFLEDKMIFPEGKEGPSPGAVVNYTSPAGVVGYGDVAPQGRGRLAVQHSSSLANARAGDLISWGSLLSCAPEAWPYGQEQEQEAQRQPQGGVVMDAVTCHWEVVRPELSSSVPGSREAAAPVSCSAEGDEWVTVFGFGVDETNLVLREFEKCGPVLNYVPGSGTVNWIHLRYQNSYEAESALRKDGMQLNSALIVGVKPLDRLQRLALTEAAPPSKLPALLPLLLRSPTTNTFATPPPPNPALQSWGRPRPYSSLQLNESGTAVSRAGLPPAPSSLASPVKSTFSKLVDLIFGQ